MDNTDEIKNQIIHILKKFRFNLKTQGTSETADEILALPAGLVIKKACDNCSGAGNIDVGNDMAQLCYKCAGTGKITRDLTLQETLEWAIIMAKQSQDDWSFIEVKNER